MQKNKTKKLFKYIQMSILCGLLGVIIALTAGFAIEKYFNDYFNLGWVNFSFKFRQNYFPAKNKPCNDIVVVLFDNATAKYLKGAWPFDRGEFAKVVEFLRLAGARAILFDVIFSEKNPNNPKSDEMLIRAVKKTNNVYLGSKFYKDTKEDKEKEALIKKFALDLKSKTSKELNKRNFITLEKDQQYKVSFNELTSVAANIGFFNTPTSSDVIRKGYLVICQKEDCYSSLPLSYYLDSLDTKTVQVAEGKYFQIGETQIPVDKDNHYYINWYGGIEDISENPDYYKQFLYRFVPAWWTIKSYNNILNLSKKLKKSPDKVYKAWYDETDNKILDELELSVDPDEFKDKIVFVGIAAAGAQDNIQTPFGTMPGIFYHAFILDNILNKKFIKVPGPYVNLFILCILSLMTSATIIYASYKNRVYLLLLPVFYLLVFSFFTLLLFGMSNILVNWSTPMIGGAVTYFLSTTYYFFVEGKDKKQIKRAMANYISPQIMNIVLENPELLKPDAITRKTITIFFFDIRSFTTITENNPPELIAKMLNEYHSEIINIIFKNKGTLDKIIGDAIMAFWNAPVDIEDHPFLAVKSALEIKEKLQELNESWSKVFNHYIDFGIGINTDDVVVGNIGSEKFMDYTVIGDGVNLASRLEGLNKSYQTNIIISDHTYKFVSDRMNVKYLGKAKVKGKSVDTNIYELVGFNEEYLTQIKGDLDEKN